MSSTPFVIVILAFIILLSPFIAKTIRFPLAVVEILLGSLVGYIGILHGNTFDPIIAKTGFLFLMFLAGLEVNLKAFLTMNSDLLKRAVGYFLILYGLSALLVWYWGLSLIYLVAFPIVSLGMIMALIKELGKNEPWLKLVLMIGILGELVSIMALTLLSGAFEYGFNVNFAKVIGTLLLFLASTIFVFRAAKILFWWYPNLKKAIMPDSDNKDQDVRLSMALFFIMVGMMIYLGLDMVLGAFIAGMFITTFFEYKSDLPHKLSSIGFGFLVPIFFVYVGSTLNFEALINPHVMGWALQIVAVLLILRVISSTVYLTRLGWFNTLLLAMGDSMPLTFLLAVATIGKEAHAISDTEYYALIIAGMVAAVTMMTAIKIIYTLFISKGAKRDTVPNHHHSH